MPPNNVLVLIDREHLCLEYYSALDYHHWRTTPPKISEKQAKDKAEKVWHGKGTARKAMLWERVRKGSKEIRTVWTVGVFLPFNIGLEARERIREFMFEPNALCDA